MPPINTDQLPEVAQTTGKGLEAAVRIVAPYYRYLGKPVPGTDGQHGDLDIEHESIHKLMSE